MISNGFSNWCGVCFSAHLNQISSICAHNDMYMHNSLGACPHILSICDAVFWCCRCFYCRYSIEYCEKEVLSTYVSCTTLNFTLYLCCYANEVWETASIYVTLLCIINRSQYWGLSSNLRMVQYAIELWHLSQSTCRRSLLLQCDILDCLVFN